MSTYHTDKDGLEDEGTNLHTHTERADAVKTDPFEPGKDPAVYADGSPITTPGAVVTVPESVYDRMVQDLRELRAEKAARAVGPDAIPRIDDIHAAFGAPVEHGAFWETKEPKEPMVPWSFVAGVLERSSGNEAELAHQREILRMKLDCLCRLTGDAEAPATEGHYREPADGARIGGIFSRSPW
jgi:hypothetical protein